MICKKPYSLRGGHCITAIMSAAVNKGILMCSACQKQKFEAFRDTMLALSDCMHVHVDAPCLDPARQSFMLRPTSGNRTLLNWEGADVPMARYAGCLPTGWGRALPPSTGCIRELPSCFLPPAYLSTSLKGMWNPLLDLGV